MKRVLGITLAAAVALTLCQPAPAGALLGLDGLVKTTSQTVEDARRRAEEEVRLTTGAVQPSVLAQQTTQQDVDARKRALEQKLSEKRAAISEKLSGERAKRCQAKQDNINKAVDIRTSVARKHFDRLKAAQNKLISYVEKKQLVIDNATALIVIMNDKQVAAEATISALEAADFTCQDADASAPGRIVIEQISAAKQALRDYRTAIKDYAAAVRLAATAKSEEQ